MPIWVLYTNRCWLLQAEEADDDDIYNVLSTLKRLTAFHKYDLQLFQDKNMDYYHWSLWLTIITESEIISLAFQIRFV